jgi:hypothetical protein
MMAFLKCLRSNRHFVLKSYSDIRDSDVRDTETLLYFLHECDDNFHGTKSEVLSCKYGRLMQPQHCVLVTAFAVRRLLVATPCTVT